MPLPLVERTHRLHISLRLWDGCKLPTESSSESETQWPTTYPGVSIMRILPSSFNHSLTYTIERAPNYTHM